MSRTVPVAPPVRIAATTPLRRTGLLRVLRDAGVNAADDADEAAVTVRTMDDQTSNSPIELSIGADNVGIELRSVPSRQDWELVIQLVEFVLGNLNDSRDD